MKASADKGMKSIHERWKGRSMLLSDINTASTALEIATTEIFCDPDEDLDIFEKIKSNL